MEQPEKQCTGCGGALERVRGKIPLGGQAQGLLALFDDSFYVDVYRCTQCARVELYETPVFVPSMIICPKCGNHHSMEIGCPHCALNDVYSRENVLPQTDRKKKARRKPPWER